MSKRSNRPKSLICEGCGQTGAKHVVLDDRGLQAGVFQFCVQCTPKLKYRTGDYVVRWFRVSPDLPPSRKPHRDVDLFNMPRWGDEGYVSPYDLFHTSSKKRRRRVPKTKSKELAVADAEEYAASEVSKDDREEYNSDDEEEDRTDDAHSSSTHKQHPSSSTETTTSTSKPKTNFFGALAAAKAAGPMPAHIKPLKRLAMEVAVQVTLDGHHLGAFERLRLRMPACLQEDFVLQMVETNRLSDYHARKRQEAKQAEMENNKGTTVKFLEAQIAQHEVEELKEAIPPAGVKVEGKEEAMDPLTVAMRASTNNQNSHWKQFSKYFLNALQSFVWEEHPQMVDVSSCGLGPRDLVSGNRSPCLVLLCRCVY